MSTSVLYDHPGPAARRRSIAYSIGFLAIFGAVGWWAVSKMADKGELSGDKWRPFTTGQVWTTFLIPGIEATLKAAALSMVIALPAGALLAFARLSARRWIRWPAVVVVEFFRAIPVALLMLFALTFYLTSSNVSSDQRPLYAVVTGLVLYNGSVLCEIFRAGILALPRGQTEAGLAIGLSDLQVLTRILMPQALTAMLPAVVSQLVVVLKDTALGGQLVGFVELMRMATRLTSNFSNSVASYTVIGLLYVTMNFLLSALAGQLERWLRRQRGSRNARRVIAVPLPGGLAGGAPPGGAMGPPELPQSDDARVGR